LLLSGDIGKIFHERSFLPAWGQATAGNLWLDKKKGALLEPSDLFEGRQFEVTSAVFTTSFELCV